MVSNWAFLNACFIVSDIVLIPSKYTILIPSKYTTELHRKYDNEMLEKCSTEYYIKICFCTHFMFIFQVIASY